MNTELKPLLRVENLSIKTQDGEILVHPTSFKLFAGKALTIVGETGSGKTLLAQAIANNLPDDLIATGQIYLFDQPIHDLSKAQRNALWGKSISIIPQEPMRSLDPTMHALKQVSEGYHLVKGLERSDANQQALKDFDKLELNDAIKKYSFELSGGMAQRVAFLAARSSGATFTIADEPTKGLDTNKRDDVSKQLLNLVNNNEGVLTITHDIEVAKQLEGDVMIMHQGQVIESGDYTTVLNMPAEPYTQELIAADPKRWQARVSQYTKKHALIEISKLSKERSGKTLFKDLSFKLYPKQIIGVSGESGSGKSTLGDLLLGLLSANQGEVHWSKQLNKKYKAQKLFQDPSDVFPTYSTLKKSFTDVMNKYHIPEKKLTDLLIDLRLDQRLIERYPDQVSGGELQRLAIARVMLVDPMFIFADEPTSRLDMLTQKTVIELLIATTQKNNVAMMIVSHDKTLLDRICDNVITISN